MGHLHMLLCTQKRTVYPESSMIVQHIDCAYDGNGSPRLPKTHRMWLTGYLKKVCSVAPFDVPKLDFECVC